MKVADTEREKAQKKLQRAIVTNQGQAIGLGTIPALGLGTLASAAYYQQVCVFDGIMSCSNVLSSCYSYSRLKPALHQATIHLVWAQVELLQVCVIVY